MMKFAKIAQLKFGIQSLILLHFTVFILPLIIKTQDMSRYVLSSSPEGVISQWWSVVTHQFVHTGIDELILSMGALWLFGSILQKRTGGRRVLKLYFISAIISSAVFILAHLIFPTFAGRNHLMEGAFISVLAVMTATVAICGSKQIHIVGSFSVSLLQLYLALVAVSFISTYQHNIACVLTYSSSIFIGIMYADRARNKFRLIQSPLTNRYQKSDPLSLSAMHSHNQTKQRTG
jgi:membrane associated rhomboid family serine protease